MVALQGQVAIHKRHPSFLAGHAPWERTAQRSGAFCVLWTQWNSDRRTGPLYEVPIM
ncbi:unnamed protein product [Staurois parvus]|uniref:Uncharacterized protein n=1 Tax=Staurois parvus TaxID=386267 RepID=A0ABN9GPL9_9NEOB|nr:unnamed protein product [Staurois parvus]CAI9610817.1 unnamed protein product [Staurois parvus]